MEFIALDGAIARANFSTLNFPGPVNKQVEFRCAHCLPAALRRSWGKRPARELVRARAEPAHAQGAAPGARGSLGAACACACGAPPLQRRPPQQPQAQTAANLQKHVTPPQAHSDIVSATHASARRWTLLGACHMTLKTGARDLDTGRIAQTWLR